MLVQLLYASRAVAPVRPDLLASILKKSTHNNAALGVTGLLCHTDDIFLQVLEGGRTQVSALYNRISQDPRHREVTLLTYRSVAQRNFSGWTMGQVDMSRINPALVLKYAETSTLDPYAMPGDVALALLNTLVDTASVTCIG